MSLTTCIRKAGTALRAEDKTAILARTRELMKAGQSAQQAAEQAVDAQIATVRALLAKYADPNYQPASAAPQAAPTTTEQTHGSNEGQEGQGRRQEGLLNAQAVVHQDPGQPAEAATKPVVADALKTAAKREDRPLAEMKADLLAQIDAAIAKAPSTEDIDADIGIGEAKTRNGKREFGGGRRFGDETVNIEVREGSADHWHIALDHGYDGKGTRRKPEVLEVYQGGLAGARGRVLNYLRSAAIADGKPVVGQPQNFVEFDVPGDGKFKVLNFKDRLQDFRRKVETSPGFKAAKRPATPHTNNAGQPTGVESGSGSVKSTIENMIDDGDVQAAVDFAAAKKVDIREVLKDQKSRLAQIAGLTPTEAAAEPAPAAPAPEAEQPTPAQEPEPTPEPAASVEPPKEGIQDLGEKIGGARKDMEAPSERKAPTKPADARPAWARRFTVSQILKSGNEAEEGRWAIHDEKNTNFMGQPRQVGPTFATQEEAEKFVPLAAMALKHRVRMMRDGKYEIWRNVTDRKAVKVVDRQFDTNEEATKYMVDHAAEILETNTTFGEESLPLPAHLERKGAERRNGDVKGDDFMRTFGFRGVEFGNWNSQEERQQVMNEAFDGLLDLADVLGIPPKAISLGGDLALAFGARGHGLSGARAHYEPAKAVINLTKMKGAGALAHEWFHAFDHYFARQDGKAPAEWVTEKDGTRSLKIKDDSYLSEGVSFKTRVRKEITDAYMALGKVMTTKAEQYVEDTAKADQFVGKMREELAAHLQRIRDSLAQKTTYGRKRDPATAEQLGKFDTIAENLLAGNDLTADYRNIEGSKARLGRMTNDSLEAINTILKDVRGRQGFDSQNQDGTLDRLRGHMKRYAERLRMLESAKAGETKEKRVPTSFAMSAKELDQGRSGDYWTSPREMFARAFQGYVEDKIAAGEGYSPFLNYAPENYAILTPWGAARPYPHGTERQAINAAFDKLVSTLETKTDDAGNVVMFSRAQNFGDKVDAVLAGGVPDDAAVPVSEPLPVLETLGMPALPVQTTAARLNKMHFDHGLTAADLKALPSLLEQPVMVFESVTQPGSKVLVLDLWRRGMPVLAAVHPNVKLKRLDVNLLASAYPKDRPEQLGNWFKNGLLRYADKDKTRAWATNGGVQFPWLVQLQRGSGKSVLGPGDVGNKPAARRTGEAQQLADHLSDVWANAPRVVAVDSMADPRVPQVARDELARQDEGTPTDGKTTAFYYNDTVYLIGEQSEREALTSLFHEVLGHHGLRHAFPGGELRTILDRIAQLNPGLVRAKAKQYGLDFDKTSDRRIAAEEVLAEMAQTRPQLGWVRRALAAIRTWLRKHVPGFGAMKFSDAELIRSFILPARAWVERGASEKAPQTSDAPAFARTDTDAFKRERSAPSGAAAGGVEAGSHQSVVDGLQRHAKALADLLEREPLTAQQGTGRVIPASVVSHVVAVSDNDQIRRAIVGALPVAVVDFFAGQQLTADHVLRNPAVLKDVLAVNGRSDVSLPVDEATALVRVVARTAAERAPRLAGGALKGQTAGAASDVDTVARAHGRSVTETAAFSKWFGDSKVVDKDGKPLVVYHGTTKDFSQFQSHANERVMRQDGHELRRADPEDLGPDGKGSPDAYHYLALSDAEFHKPSEALAIRRGELAGLRERNPGESFPDSERVVRDLERLAAGGPITKTVESRPSGVRPYFTPDQDYSFIAKSGGWNGQIREGGNVLPVYLSIKNPVYLDASAIESAGWRWEQYARQGYDGAIFAGYKNDLTRRDPMGGSTQIVAFDPTQIKSAIGNRGTFDPNNPDVRFSRVSDAIDTLKSAEPTKVSAQDLVTTSGGVFDFNRLGETQQDRIRTVIDGSRPFWLGALTRDQIADIYGNDIPQVKEYDQLTRAMENERSKRAQDAEAIYNRWAQLSAQENARLARIMADATLYSVHPDADFNPGVGEEPEADRQAVHARIHTEYGKLSEAAKAVYRDVRDHHEATLNDLMHALEQRIERQVEAGAARQAAITDIRQRFDKYRQDGPYFPLSRFGNYLVVAQREDGQRVVAAYETPGEQQAAARALQKDGFTVKTKAAKAYTRAEDGSAGKFIGDVLAKIDALDMEDATLAGQKQDLKSRLLDDVNQLFITALPDLSFRKHFKHRMGTPGFSSDMMRGFASSAFHAASHIARLNHGDKMTFALRDAFSAIESATSGDHNTASQVMNELAKRHDAALNPNTHPIASMLNSLGFVMYLGASPAAGLMNGLQVPMVTLPYLGARHGFGKASRAVSKAYGDIFSAPWNRTSGFNAAESLKLTPAERQVMSALIDEGVIDLTQAHDLAAATGLDTGNVARSKAAFAVSRAMKIVGWTFHIPEVLNRQVTALAAYRLAMNSGATPEAAMEAARDAIKRTQFDYSSSNRARYMQGNLGRVVLQFKQYAQNMTYFIGRAAYQVLHGESPEVRAIARRQLMATLGVTFAMSGALGLPGLGTLGGLIALLAKALSDDDEPWDWEVEFRNLMADTFGKDAGEVISRGVPRALMPWDISTRVGMGDLWFRKNNREGQSPREAFASDLANILGPTAGSLLGWYTAADHMARGNYAKAAEAITPKAIRDIIKAGREGTQGVTSYSGEPLMDLTPAESIGRLLGFAPARASEMYEGRNAVMNAKTAIDEKRRALLTSAAKARIDGDAAAVREAQEQIVAWNKRHPDSRITPGQIIQSVRNRKQRERNMQDGIVVPKNRNSLREIGRFATTTADE